MDEREVVSADPIEKTDWENDAACMSSDVDMSDNCSNEADTVVATQYEDEPDKTFYSLLCDECATSYMKQIDEANIFGDEYTLGGNEFRVN